jgi:hypothetical protein
MIIWDEMQADGRFTPPLSAAILDRATGLRRGVASTSLFVFPAHAGSTRLPTSCTSTWPLTQQDV